MVKGTVGPAMIPMLRESGVVEGNGWMLGERMEVDKGEYSSPLGGYKIDYVVWPGNYFYHCHSYSLHRGELYWDSSQNLLVCSDDSEPIELTCGNETVYLEPGDNYSGEVGIGILPDGRGTLTKKNGQVIEGEFNTKDKNET